MNNLDKTYTKLLQDIIHNGVEKFKEHFKNIDVPKEIEVMDFLERNKKSTIKT